jgi:hypothetical protein
MAARHGAPRKVKMTQARKRLRNRVLIVAGLAAILSPAVGIYLYNVHPMLLRLVIGQARLLNEDTSMSVLIEGKKSASAKCFPFKKWFNGDHADGLVLWIPQKGSNYGREILIIDRRNRAVGYGNTSDQQYHLYIGRFLIQAESGAGYISFTSAKASGEDPKYEVTGHGLRFHVPNSEAILPGRRIEVLYTRA